MNLDGEMTSSDKCNTRAAGTPKLLETNNNQCCNFQKQLFGGNNDGSETDSLCQRDTMPLDSVANDSKLTIRKRPILDSNGEVAAGVTTEHTKSSHSATSNQSNSSTEGEATDEVEPFFENDSDWITTTSFKRTNPDMFLPVPILKFATAALIVFFLSALCFCISYDAELIFDDRAAIKENPDILPETPWTNVFWNDFWGRDLHSEMSHKSYRPLTTLTFRLSYYFGGGLNPVWFHVPNILLHAIISVLLLRVFSILFGGYQVNLDTNEVEFLAPKSSFLCATIFAVHPIHTECVAGVVGRADLLCAMLFLLSVLLYIKSCAKELHESQDGLIIYRPIGFSVWWMLGSMLLCFLAVFCKEQGLTVLGICSAYDIILVCRLGPPQFFVDKTMSKTIPCHEKDAEKLVQCGGHVTKTFGVCNGHVEDIHVDSRCNKHGTNGNYEADGGSETGACDGETMFRRDENVEKSHAHCVHENRKTCECSELITAKSNVYDQQTLEGRLEWSQACNRKPSTSRLWISALIKRHMFLLATGLITMWVRLYVMGPHPPHFEVFDNPHSFIDGPFTRVLNYNYLYSLNAWILVHPWWLCCDWSMGCVPVIMTPFDLRILGGVALWLVLGALLFSGLKPPITGEQRILTMALALIAVPFLPASNLFFRVGFVVAERILYLSSIGFCMLVVLGLRRICSTYPKEVMTIRAVVVLFLCVYIVRCLQRTTYWRTDLDLVKSGEQVCPLNAKIHYNMGVHLYDIGRIDEAMERYRQTIRLNPLYYNALHNLGMLLNKKEKYAEAEGFFERAIEVKEDFAKAWMNLGVAKEKLKKYKEAEKCYFTALHHEPKYPKCLLNMGRMYLALKDHNKAIETWWKAIAMDHNQPTGWYNIAVVLHNLERYNQGIDVLNRGLSFNPGAHNLLFLLADTYKKAGKWPESERTYLEAISSHPNESALYFNLGILYQEWKKYDLAEKYYRETLIIQPNAPHVIKKLGTLPYHK